MCRQGDRVCNGERNQRLFFNVQDAEIWHFSPGITAISILASHLSRRNFLEARSQRRISLFHIVSKLLPLETGAGWIGKKAPCASEPFLQRLYILIQSVGHKPHFPRYSGISLRDSLP